MRLTGPLRLSEPLARLLRLLPLGLLRGIWVGHRTSDEGCSGDKLGRGASGECDAGAAGVVRMRAVAAQGCFDHSDRSDRSDRASYSGAEVRSTPL
ncbi:hypothetical protein GCM10009603_01980 [Nocardiopsis exhalans]